MTQAQLARAAGVSIHSVSAYELDRRAPAGDTVIRRLAAILGIDPGPLINAASFGFDASVPLDARVRMSDLQAQAERYPWPCLMNNENLEVVGINGPGRTLAGVDISTITEPGGRHLLRLLLDDELGRHLLNREDVLRRLASILKSDRIQPGGGPNGPRFMPALVEWLGQVEASVRAWLLGLWALTPEWEYGNRVAFYAEWQAEDGAVLRFNCLVTPWSDLLGVWAFDWLPADGPNWEWFRSHSAFREPSSGPRWNVRLDERRHAYGLSRREVADLADVSESTVYQWERGTRKPTPAHLTALVRGPAMDGATAGLVAEELGFDPIPSAAYRYLRGETVAGRPDLASLEVQEIDTVHIRGEIETHPWPCLIVDAAGAVARANSRASWLLEPERSGLGLAPEPFAILGSQWFRESCTNWLECAPTLLEFPARLLPRRPEPSADALRFVRSQPGGEDALAELELAIAGYIPEPASRAFTTLHWHQDGLELTFHCVVSPWNIWDPYVAIDLHPADGGTWDWVNARGRPQDPGLR